MLTMGLNFHVSIDSDDLWLIHWGDTDLDQHYCCLTTRSQYPNHCSVIIKRVLWHSPDFTSSAWSVKWVRRLQVCHKMSKSSVYFSYSIHISAMTVLHNVVYMNVVKQKFWNLLHQPGPRLDIKNGLSRYAFFHFKDKTVVRPFELYTMNHFAGKKSLYWHGPQVSLWIGRPFCQV